MAVTFDLFGTLVEAEYPSDPAAAVAIELERAGVAVPDDWGDAYREVHIDAPEGAEVPLPAHVSAALGSRGVDAPNNASRRAVVNAFDPAVRTRPDAVEAVAAAAERGPVGLLSNCSVPELVRRTLIRSAVPNDAFDATVTSVACGWRKPDARAFETVASALDASPESLLHVGDDARTDGGVEALGGEFVDVAETPLAALVERFQRTPTGDGERTPAGDGPSTGAE
ncbi:MULTISPECIES: HAD family hydrolase [Haloprofundus]|uniref:HAD family hydrolase n=1 Tax=Haloprofundus TaxID=1911573 RepID=UPI000E442197|nr:MULTISPECIES: HAD family hydrolase [Haloprofundus]QCJ47381.1 HAD family hydrolase [Haloprofundus sp. MHR1]